MNDAFIDYYSILGESRANLYAFTDFNSALTKTYHGYGKGRMTSTVAITGTLYGRTYMATAPSQSH